MFGEIVETRARQLYFYPDEIQRVTSGTGRGGGRGRGKLIRMAFLTCDIFFACDILRVYAPRCFPRNEISSVLNSSF